MAGKRTNPHYFCEDCLLPFAVYVVSHPKKKYFCPYCGDSIEVVRYTGEHAKSDEVGKKIRWTDDEKDIIREVIEGKNTQIQAVHLLGRTVDSVSKMIRRIKDEEY